MLSRLLSGLAILALGSHRCLAKVVPLIQPGFFFDYNIQEQPVPIPITTQCQRIHIKWGRNGAIGQNPTAPYSLQVFTSTATTPFIVPAGDKLNFDWDVPFAPGTQYQICMFDKNGVPGGCQAMYTVVHNTTTAQPSCQNVTAPPQLAIEGKVAGGPISQYGFVDQCTDISITPKGGKPPYTLTISPPLHPPYNITSDNLDPIVWTVSLSWSYPFFISLVSADGQMWANGPMHAGGFGPSECLAPGSISRHKAMGIAAGASVGTLFAGMMVALGGLWLLRISQQKKFTRALQRFSELKDQTDIRSTSASELDRPLPPIPRRFASLGGTDEWNQAPRQVRSNITNLPVRLASPGELPVRSQTIIVHYDGGRIQAQGSASESETAIELPPEYRRLSPISSSGSSSLSEPRATPTRKAPRYT